MIHRVVIILVFCAALAFAARAERLSAPMVPKTQLDALQKQYDELEDRLRRTPQCLRMWTNLPGPRHG